MNREIKFRFWNHYTKVMLKPRSLHDLIDSPVPSQCYHNAMQFTGLTDNKGQEIYEGDILSIKFTDEFHNECISIEDGDHQCNVNVHWDSSGYWMFSEPDSTWYLPQSLDGLATIEVIGNIHENPELLEDL